MPQAVVVTGLPVASPRCGVRMSGSQGPHAMAVTWRLIAQLAPNTRTACSLWTDPSAASWRDDYIVLINAVTSPSPLAPSSHLMTPYSQRPL